MTTKVGGVEALNAWLAQSGYKMRHAEPRLRVSPQAAGAARSAPRGRSPPRKRPGLQYAMTDNPLFEHYRSLFTGERAAWLDVVRDPANRRTARGEPAQVDGRRSQLLARRHQRARDRPHARGIERETIASPASCGHDAHVHAPPARRIAPPSAFRRRPRRAQDRRQRQHRQRRRHHLRALGTDRDCRPGQRHHGLATAKPRIASAGSPSSWSITSTARRRRVGQAPSQSARTGSVRFSRRTTNRRRRR